MTKSRTGKSHRVNISIASECRITYTIARLTAPVPIAPPPPTSEVPLSISAATVAGDRPVVEGTRRRRRPSCGDRFRVVVRRRTAVVCGFHSSRDNCVVRATSPAHAAGPVVFPDRFIIVFARRPTPTVIILYNKTSYRSVINRAKFSPPSYFSNGIRLTVHASTGRYTIATVAPRAGTMGTRISAVSSATGRLCPRRIARLTTVFFCVSQVSVE